MATERRTGLLGAAVVVLAVALVATIAFFLTRSPATDQGTSTPTPSTDAGETYESACGLSGGPVDEPTSSPPGVEMVRIDGWPYPVSETSGPGERSDDGPWSCFARTPLGSVLAISTISLRLVLAEDFEAVVAESTTPGIGRDALLEAGQTQDPGGIAEPKGFRIEEWTPSNAIITLWTAQDGQNYGCTGEVVWLDGDWRVRPDSRGFTATGCTEGIPGGVVQWGVS